MTGDFILRGPEVFLPSDRSLHDAFVECAAAHPRALAVVSEDRHLTYQELDQRTTQLGRYLQGLGVGRGSFVGVCLGRSERVAVALLGILKAGAAYVPLDPAYPAERLRHITADTRSSVILVDDAFKVRFTGSPARLIALDRDFEWLEEDPSPLPRTASEPGSIAYVIYTSGSTGRPKGVCCHHFGVLNLLADFQDRQPLMPTDRCSWWTSLNFDVSVYEIFSPLTEGATLVVVPDSVRADAPLLMEWLDRNRITSAYLPPFMVADLLAWVERNPGKSLLRRLLVGVEPIPERTLRAIGQAVDGLRIINGYGPTETTICSTLYTVPHEGPLHDNAPIGSPVWNTSLYLLDEEGRGVEPGNPGELFIGGAGVAGGYLGRPELNAERFLPDPYSDRPGTVMYRTGDKVRLLPDGNLEFLGRIDFQVKVRGFRVELGEIETHLRKMEGVREAVVLLREDSPDRRQLVAYLTVHEGTRIGAGKVRAHLQRFLPDYMIPSSFVQLDRMPTTPNGKTDRRALPAPDSGNRLPEESSHHRPPQTETEKVLAGFFEEILAREGVGLDGHFFELGGHSLLATQLVSRIREAFGVEVPVSTVFRAPTVEMLAREVAGAVEPAKISPEPPLVPSGDTTEAPLSFPQLRVWYLDRLDPGTPAYNICLVYRLNGPLQPDILETCLAGLAERHPSLRTVFSTRGGRPVQVVREALRPAFQRVDLTRSFTGDREQEALRLCTEESGKGFDLGRGPLFRVLLVKTAETEYFFMMTVHHIVSDGWSMGILLNELMELYSARLAGRPPSILPLPITYGDFARWQKGYMEGPAARLQINYWKEVFRRLPEPLELPTDHPRPPIQSYRGAGRSLVLGEPIFSRIIEFGEKEGASLFMTLLAAFKALLFRMTHQGDICVGTFIANRNRLQIEGLVGFFINSLALRTDLSDDPPFQTLLQRVRETALGAYAHQDLPFERILEEINPERDLSRTPLFQVMMVLQNMPLPPLGLPGIDCSPVHLDTVRSNFDLTLWVYEEKDSLRLVMEYSTDLFEEGTILGMLRYFKNLLQDALDLPTKRLSQLSLLSPGETEAILKEWRGRWEAFQRPVQTVPRQFEETALSGPHMPALVSLGDHRRQMTYGELHEASDRMAGFLQRKGIGPESLVAVLMDRSPLLVVALLGILKSGAAYVPIDPNHPVERIAFILKDSGTRLLLTVRSHMTRLTERAPDGVEFFCIDDDWLEAAANEAPPDACPASFRNLAYAIYTSGSTGQPKGVLIEHGSLAAFVKAALDLYEITPADRVLQFASVSFDASIEEIFPTLCCGATLVLRSDEMIRSIPAFLQACTAAEITILDLPTGFWHQMVSALQESALPWPPSVRLVIIGGEQALPDKVGAWREMLGERVRLVNTYGPTEATVVATAAELSGAGLPRRGTGRVPIGRPLPHMKMLVLDPHNRVVPPGVPGELFLGGAGLARGYLNRPEKTAGSFVADPLTGNPEDSYYRTGDLVRWRLDGNLEFLGRVDRQVKIRGFRVELEEIETALNSLPAVKSSVVVAREDRLKSLRLVAYTVMKGGAAFDGEALRQALVGLLPDFMIPSAYVEIQEIPLTPSGKVDTAALPDPQMSPDHRLVPPRNPVEETLAEIWCTAFGLQRVGVHDNFFALGGHSLLSIEIIDRVNRAGLWLTPSQFMQNPTIAELAQVITSAHHGGPTEAWSCLVDLQPEGSRPPLYFIHSTPGDVLGYMNLINHLGHSQSCFGFQSLGLKDVDRRHTRVQDMAACYIGEMLAFQQQGPYFLVGWCYGGIVAAEMAVQLQKMGHKVGMLFLIETPFPRTDSETFRYYLLRLSGLLQMGPKGWRSYVRNKLKYRQKIRRGEFDTLFSLHHDAGPLANRSVVYRTNQQAMDRYRLIGRPRCPIRIFSGDQLVEGIIPDPQHMWLRQGGDVREYVFPGNHLTILREPGVGLLAGQLSACLDEVRNLF